MMAVDEEYLQEARGEFARQQQALSTMYGDVYAADVRKRREEQLARELGFAQDVEAGMRTGATSSALAQQRLAMGQAGAQQAAAMASGNPLASRAAMFAGAQQAGQLAGAGAMGRSQEMGGAMGSLLQGYGRQAQGMQQLEAMEIERANMMAQAARQATNAETAAQAAQQQRTSQLIASGLGAAGAIGQSFAGGFAPKK
jgi:hypothetical protein